KQRLLRSTRKNDVCAPGHPGLLKKSKHQNTCGQMRGETMMIYYGVFRQPYYRVDDIKVHSGGEATIHRVVGHPGLIAKIYHEERLSSTPTAREDMKQKVVAMINLPLQTQEDGNLVYAWPTDLLF